MKTRAKILYLAIGLLLGGIATVFADSYSTSPLLQQSYTIDFGAFAGGGASQNSAQAMTGVILGDACSVGVNGDVSAEMATLGVEVTSAGNIVIVLTPLTAAGVVNPASHIYTVKCAR